MGPHVLFEKDMSICGSSRRRAGVTTSQIQLLPLRRLGVIVGGHTSLYSQRKINSFD